MEICESKGHVYTKVSEVRVKRSFLVREYTKTTFLCKQCGDVKEVIT
jgi:hypothetical protein